MSSSFPLSTMADFTYRNLTQLTIYKRPPGQEEGKGMGNSASSGSPDLEVGEMDKLEREIECPQDIQFSANDSTDEQVVDSTNNENKRVYANEIDIIEEARKEMESHIRKNLKNVLRPGFVIMLVGPLMTMVIYTINLNWEIPNSIYITLFNLFILLGCCGLLMISTVPVEYLNIEDILKDSQCFRMSVFCILFGISIPFGIFPPYLGFLLLIPTFMLLASKTKRTYYLWLYYFAFYMLMWPVYLRAALYADDPDASVLGGYTPFASSDTQGEEFREVWIGTSCYFLVSWMIFVSILYWHVYLDDTGGHILNMIMGKDVSEKYTRLLYPTLDGW